MKNLSYVSDKNKKEKIYNITITSLLTSLSIVLSLVCKFFILPFATWLNVDISLISQIVIYVCIKGKYSIFYSIFSLFITSVTSIAWYGTGDLIGVLISFISGLIYISIYCFFYMVFKFKNLKIYLISTILSSLILTTFVLTLLNGLLFTPMYWSYLGISSLNFLDCEMIYNMNPNIYLLNMPTYWTGIFALYISFNSIKFMCISIIIFSLLLVISNKINIRKNNYKKIKKFYI